MSNIGILHLSSSNTGTVSLAMMEFLNLSLLVTQGHWPEASSTALRFYPVVVLMSIETKLANIATSLLVLFLRFLKKVAYLTRMLVLADSISGERTCWSKYVLVSLGQSQASLMAVFHALNTWQAPSPDRSHSIDS